jgi:uncharacterized protein
MQLIYDNYDITNSFNISASTVIDNAGGVADVLEIALFDNDDLPIKWKPQKNDVIRIKENSFSSGEMYIDHIEQNRGCFVAKAISIPINAKEINSKSWENIRFLSLMNEITSKYGFSLETHNIIDHFYVRVDQIDQTDFEFIAYRCMLEGYMIKFTDKKVVLYDEKYIESMTALINIDVSEFDGSYSFKDISSGLFSACSVSFNSIDGLIKSEYRPSTAPFGPVLKKYIYLGNQGEADRFAKGFLRAANKRQVTGVITVKLNSGIAAGTNINITGLGLFDGKYFVDQIIHKFNQKKSTIKLRKPLVGY